jgi:hypothetical protein
LRNLFQPHDMHQGNLFQSITHAVFAAYGQNST